MFGATTRHHPTLDLILVVICKVVVKIPIIPIIPPRRRNDPRHLPKSSISSTDYSQLHGAPK